MLLAQASSLLRSNQPPGTHSPFTDVTKQAGINWVHDKLCPRALSPETVGAGCLLLDYDNVAGWTPNRLTVVRRIFSHPANRSRTALYHNNHDGTFTDLTDKAGVAVVHVGMGAAG